MFLGGPRLVQVGGSLLRKRTWNYKYKIRYILEWEKQSQEMWGVLDFSSEISCQKCLQEILPDCSLASSSQLEHNQQLPASSMALQVRGLLSSYEEVFRNNIILFVVFPDFYKPSRIEDGPNNLNWEHWPLRPLGNFIRILQPTFKKKKKESYFLWGKGGRRTLLTGQLIIAQLIINE